MPFNIRNLIIFLAIGMALSSVYYFFMRTPEPASNLVTKSVANNVPADTANVSTAAQNELAKELLSRLLNVKEIKLNTEIFSEQSFNSLVDSSIEIKLDTIPGRPNPFAQFGADSVEGPVTSPAPTDSATPSAATPTPATTPAPSPAVGR